MLGAPGKVDVYNIELVEANTIYYLPRELNYFVNCISIQARSSVSIKIHFNDSIEYITLKPGGVYWEQNIKYAGTVSFESDTASTIVEVVTFGEVAG